ncbi:MAG: DUF6250 domain-containing protein [Bacteroidota bacterium]|nr:DUF6250 domain-containing protein [Bacteroidota bacterium]
MHNITSLSFSRRLVHKVAFAIICLILTQSISAKKIKSALLPQNWTIEQESPQTKVRFSKDTVEIDSPKGITLWYNQPLSGDITISYKALFIMNGGPNDRLSDLNSFWMAQDSLHPNDFFARKEWRGGVFSKYYSLKMYYVGFGGNNNTTSRFRKYDGDYDSFKQGKVRPDIIKEYTDAVHLLKPNYWYNIKIEVVGNKISYTLNGEKLFDYTDPAPYRSGYFGFRTVQSHQMITGFRIEKH